MAADGVDGIGTDGLIRRCARHTARLGGRTLILLGLSARNRDLASGTQTSLDARITTPCAARGVGVVALAVRRAEVVISRGQALNAVTVLPALA